MSLEDLSTASSIALADLELIESGVVRASPRQLWVLSTALGVSVEELIPLRYGAAPGQAMSLAELRQKVVVLVEETNDAELLRGLASLLRAERAQSLDES